MNRLTSFLNIRPGEERLVWLMLLLAILTGAPNLLTETAAYAMFLGSYDAATMPYVFIGFAIVTTLSGLAYTKLEPHLSFAKFVTLNLIFLVGMLVLFRLLVEFNQARWPALALAIWYEASWALANLGFWSLAIHLFNVRQGKRLFALIGTGLTLSESLIGFLVPGLVSWVGTSNLLIVAAAGFLGAIVVQSYILRSFANLQPTDDEDEESSDQPRQTSWGQLFKNPYIVLIFAMATFYILAFFVLDNLFYERLETLFFDPDQIAGFIGLFFGTAGILSMIVGIFFSGQFLSRYGQRWGLIALPASLAIVTAFIILTGLFWEAVIILSWLVIVTKLLNEVLAHTINRAAWQVLYEPLPQKLRLRTQTVVESIIKPIAGGLAGLGLLAFSALFGFGTLQLTIFLFGVLLGWLIVVTLLNRAYPGALLKAINRRLSRYVSPPPVSDEAKTLLKQGLSNQHLGIAVHALNMLEEVDPNAASIFLYELLDHPRPEIRMEALCRIEQLRATADLSSIRRLIKQEGSPAVRGAALRTLAVVGGAQVLSEITPFLRDPNTSVRLGAIIGLAQHNHQPTTLSHSVAALASSSDPVEREFAAQLIGAIREDRANGLLSQLLQDDKLQVRRAALVAAGKLKRPELWPIVIEGLALPSLRVTATTILMRAEEAVLPAIQAAFAQSDQMPEILARLAKLCGRMGGSQAITLLKEKLSFPEARVRTQVIISLDEANYQAPNNERPIITAEIRREVAQAAKILATLLDLGEDDTVLRLKKALQNELNQYRIRIFHLLSFIYDHQSITQVAMTLDVAERMSSYRNKSYALEIVELLVTGELKAMLIPFLDNDLTSKQKLQELNNLFPQQQLSREHRLQEIIIGSAAWYTPWLKACALSSLVRLSEERHSETILAALFNPDPLVRETAVWALFNINPGLYQSYAAKLGQDSDPNVAKAVGLLNGKQTNQRIGRSLLERVDLLKTVSFLKETPAEVLAELAANLETLKFKAGEVILKNDQLCLYMYIIIAGRVQLDQKEGRLTYLEKYRIFGELSLLNPCPYPAQVTAMTDVYLLRLGQEPFFELIDDHRDLAHTVLQLLVEESQTQPHPEGETHKSIFLVN